jgi:hypothetical protein
VNEDEIGRTCSGNGKEEEYIQDLGRESRRKETTRKTDVDARIILKFILEQ